MDWWSRIAGAFGRDRTPETREPPASETTDSFDWNESDWMAYLNRDPLALDPRREEDRLQVAWNPPAPEPEDPRPLLGQLAGNVLVGGLDFMRNAGTPQADPQFRRFLAEVAPEYDLPQEAEQIPSLLQRALAWGTKKLLESDPQADDMIEYTVRRIAEIPGGERLLRSISDPETRIGAGLAGIATWLEERQDGYVAWVLDRTSQNVANAMLESGEWKAPEGDLYGAGDQPIVMDVLQANGFTPLQSFIAEIGVGVIPEQLPELGPAGIGLQEALPGALAGAGLIASRSLSRLIRGTIDTLSNMDIIKRVPDALQAATRNLDVIADAVRPGAQIADELASAVVRSADELAGAAPNAIENAIHMVPGALRDNESFLTTFGQVQARYANDLDELQNIRVWRRPVQTAPLDTAIARGEDGLPLLKSPGVPNGLTQAQYDIYHRTLNEVYDAHGGKANLERHLMDLYERSRGVATATPQGMPVGPNPAADWYPQQQLLNLFQDAVGDDVVGRAMFEYLNNVQARYSSRTPPENQAARAIWNFVMQALGQHPGAVSNPPGWSHLYAAGQQRAVAAGVTNPEILDLLDQIKNTVYRHSLSGDLGDIVADVHYARTLFNQPRLNLAGDYAMGIGQYLALRDIGVEVARKHGILPGALQAGVWIENAGFTGVKKSKYGLFSFAQEGMDAMTGVIGYIRSMDPSLKDVSDPGLLRRILQGDQQIKDIVSRITGYGDPTLSGVESIAQAMTPSAAWATLEAGARAGVVEGPADILTAATDFGLRDVGTPETWADRVRSLADAMVSRGTLDEVARARVDDLIALRSSNPTNFDRIATNWAKIDTNFQQIAANLRDPEVGGFTLDLTAEIVPLVGSASGHYVGAYPTLQRRVPLASLQNSQQVADVLSRYILDRAEFLAYPRSVLGGFVDFENNATELILDVSLGIRNADIAADVGRASDQISMFRIDDAALIDLGGTGALPDPPLGVRGAALEDWYIQEARRHHQEVIVPLVYKRPGKRPGTFVNVPGVSFPDAWPNRTTRLDEEIPWGWGE